MNFTKTNADIIIIGGGLTGLTIAYLLRKTNYKIKIVESRSRLGGRIHTLYPNNAAPIEMGATWFGSKHISLISLLKELKIDTFEQILGEQAIYEPMSLNPPQIVSLPPNTDPSFRIKGGTSTLINALVNQLDHSNIFTKEVVGHIQKTENKFLVQSTSHQFYAPIVISTLPPFLLTKTITISPELPVTLLNIATKTHTWMGESIKVGLSYKNPFWKKPNTSGTIMSNVGPIPEMYDHSDYENTNFALKGFFNGSYFSISKEERLTLVLKQLQKYYGSIVNDFISYEETVWQKEAFTFSPYDTHLLPHQNNGHSLFQNTFFGGGFFVAGSETASTHPGYMDGAINSANFVHQEVMKLLPKL